MILKISLIYLYNISKYLSNIFYLISVSIDRTIKIEHPILNLERKLMPVTIKGNIQTKLIDEINTDITIVITLYTDYIENDYSEVDNYQKLIDDCNLIFLYLENRIPKKMT